jgi:hypothetical protein
LHKALQEEANTNALTFGEPGLSLVSHPLALLQASLREAAWTNTKRAQNSK